MLFPAVGLIFIGIVVLVSPKAGIRKGKEVTEETLKDARKLGGVITMIGVFMASLALVNHFYR